MRKATIFCLIALFLSSFTLLWAQEEITILHGEVGADYPPYYMAYPDRTEGLCPEIINAVAATMGVRVRYDRVPWSRALVMMKSGEADAMFPIFKNPEREGFMYYFDSIIAYEDQALFVLKDSSIAFSGDFNPLKPYTIGCLRDYSYGPAFDAVDFPKKQFTGNEESLVKMLVAKRFDIIVGNQLVILYWARKLGVQDKITMLQPVLDRGADYLAFSKAKVKVDMAQRFSDALAKFKKTDEYKRILRRYGL